MKACALCHKVRPLRESHIIPEFLHRTLYDEKHRFKTYGYDGTPEFDLEQKGQRERLLCDECEQRFCNYERNAADFYRGTIAAFSDTTRAELNHGTSLKFMRIGEDGKPTTAVVPSLLAVEGVDYVRLKLFLLSLLWRMGVSGLPFYREVELGCHESKLRKMLLNTDPGEPHEYACQICLIEANQRLLTDYLSQPRRYRHEGMTFYRLFTTGVKFEFSVSHQSIHPALLEIYCVKRKSEFIWCVDSIEKHRDLLAELIQFGSALRQLGRK